MKWIKRLAYLALILAVLTFLVDLLTRHFFQLVVDSIGIASVMVIIWALNRLIKTSR